MAGMVSKGKAREILSHGEVKGYKLTKKQRGFFGARAGGAPMKGLTRAASRKHIPHSNHPPSYYKNKGQVD